MKAIRVAYLSLVAISIQALWTLPVQAQAVPFHIVGHIQKFSIDLPADAFSPSLMSVNGIDVMIPRNTVVVMPAAYLTPQQILAAAPAGAHAGTTGLALDDRTILTEPPLAAFEVALDGNIVGGVYIAGQVHISQQSLNNGVGFIRNINYATAEMCVGSTPTPVGTCAPPDARVRINDPKDPTDSLTPRYGANNTSPDTRFTVDQDNPTIHAMTGYPMCLPNVAPPGSDPKCPIGNRPVVGVTPLTTFVMTGADIPSSSLPPGQAPIATCIGKAATCDPDQQAPFVVGDYINYQGTLFNDGAAGHPFFISAHTIEANVGIYTQPGAGRTAYIFQEKSLLGTQGPLTGTTCVALLECTAKIRIVGFITDPSRAANVFIYAVDVNPSTRARTSRLLAANQKAQAPFGRFRFDIAKAPALLPNGFGATREIMVRIDDGNVHLPDGTLIPDKTNSPGLLKANGLIPGQYVAPVGEYLFPEGLVLGAPPPRANFQCLAFLTVGWATGGLTFGQLTPWPDAVTPPATTAGIRCDN